MFLWAQVQKPGRATTGIAPDTSRQARSSRKRSRAADVPVFFVAGQQEAAALRAEKRKDAGYSDPAREPSWLLKTSPDALERLTKYIQCVDYIHTAVGAAPCTVSEWAAKVEAARRCPKAPHVTGTTEYMRLWSIRSLLLSRMAAEGVSRLTVDSSATIRQICQMNPDMSGGLTRARNKFYHDGNAGRSTSDFVKEYGHRPELISMWMCFAVDMGLQSSDFDQFDVNTWWKAAAEYHSTHGVSPHPAAHVSEHVQL